MECEKVLEGHSSEVFSVCVVGKGRVASGSWEGELFVWDVAGGTRLMSLSGHTDWIMALLGFRNGLLASASGGRSIKVWDVSSGKLMKSLETGTPNYTLAVTSSGHLVSGGYDKLLRILPHEATGGPVTAVEVGWGWERRRKVVLFRVALRKDVRRGYGGVVGSGVC
jgi:WD40 repeat protein